MKFPASPDWIPMRFFWQHGRPFVDWCYLGRRRFTEPFFDFTLQQCMWMPFPLLFRPRTPVEALLEWQQARPGLPPAGFVFHMSRCGSTLVSQMLAALSQNIVISEASPIDSILRATRAVPGVDAAQQIAWLRALVSAWGQRRYPDERHLFIKFDCQHLLELPLLRAAFPQTPWIFLYRDPVEVMVALMKLRGHLEPTLVDGVSFGIDRAEAMRMPPEEYVARVLACILQTAIDHQSVAGGMLVNYRQLPQAVTTSIAAHFGMSWTATETEIMHRAANFDAKNPVLHFTADQQTKQRSVTEAIATASQRWLAPLYERLEALRLAAEEKCSHHAPP